MTAAARCADDVTVEEFDEEPISPLADAVVGPQAWRNDPSYLKVEEGKTIRVRNEGGRNHTFTEVAEFGAVLGSFLRDLEALQLRRSDGAALRIREEQ